MADVQHILQELYELDPSLHEHEVALEKLVAELAATRPQVESNPVFVAQLKAKLVDHAVELMRRPAPRTFSFISLFTMPKFSLALTGTAVAVVVAVVAVVSYLHPFSISTQFGKHSSAVAFAPSVTHMGERAFGTLAINSSSDSTAQSTAAAPFDLAGGGTVSSAAPKATQAAVAETAPSFASNFSLPMPAGVPGLGSGAPAMRIYQPSYTYVYQGSDLKDLPSQVEVLKRVTDGQSIPSATGLLGDLNFTGLNLGSFDGLGLAQLTLNQDQAYGYSISLDTQAGTLNVSQNSSKWPQPGQGCQDQACMDTFRLQPSQVPDDATIIALARDFLTAHGVPVAEFGAPQIMDDWRTQYQALSAADQAQFYIPDSVTVLFPLKVNNQEVFEGGNKSGVGVGVSLRDKRATGLWNLTTQQYQASAYPAITDATKILNFAEQGGYGAGGPVPYMMKGETDLAPTSEVAPVPPTLPTPVPVYPPTEQGVEVGLGAPSLAYVKTWNYQPNGNSDELLVPALAFPIVKVPVGVQVYQKFVLVPLVQDFWEQPVGGPIRILPMMGAGSASAGSAGSAETVPVPPLKKP